MSRLVAEVAESADAADAKLRAATDAEHPQATSGVNAMIGRAVLLTDGPEREGPDTFTTSIRDKIIGALGCLREGRPGVAEMVLVAVLQELGIVEGSDVEKAV